MLTICHSIVRQHYIDWEDQVVAADNVKGCERCEEM